MSTKTEKFNNEQIKPDRNEIQAGDTVRVYQKINANDSKDKNKRKIHIFEGLVLARKHGKGISATITVRKVIDGIGVEKIFPVHSPIIDKIEIVKRAKTRRAKLYYLRTAKGRKARLKRKDFAPTPASAPNEYAPEPKPEPEQPEIDSPATKPESAENTADEQTKRVEEQTEPAKKTE